MAAKYADQQPEGFKNHIENIAIVGAGGLIGGHITRALLAQNKHKVTALTRPDSTSTLPSGLHAIHRVSYSDHSSLVTALLGQDVLIITMNVLAPPDSQRRLIDAAIEAGVNYIMPNEYGSDVSDEKFIEDTRLGKGHVEVRKYIEKQAQERGRPTKWVSLTCGFWYEFSLSGTEVRYGFDLPERKVTLYGDGTARTCTSTFEQCARAVARLFALPLLPANASDTAPALSHWDNRPLFMASFLLSQRDMLASVLRVTGTTEADWTITSEPAADRFARGAAMYEKGDMLGFGMLLYARVFFPEEPGNFWGRIQNASLGLPVEEVDAWTKVAVEEWGAHGLRRG